MKRRAFVKASLALVGCGSLATAAASREGSSMIQDDGVTFLWRHEGNRLWATLTAPTPGWIAAGFNETSALHNTRFVIAAVSVSPIRVEEHIALVPDHRPVAALGMPPALGDARGAYENGTSRLGFSLPQAIPGRPTLDLAQGAAATLMLAWSHEPDFDHHSAWRRHYAVTL